MTGEEEGEQLAWLKRVVATAQEHVAYAAQIPACVEMYFNDEFDFENEEAAAVLKAETVPDVIRTLLEELPKVESLDNAAVKALFKQIQKATKLKGKDVFMPIRVALTGNQHGPELAAMVPLLGVERTAKRVKASLAKAGVEL
jgi:nondiscriminating glutamyl-tRNA synthetase